MTRRQIRMLANLVPTMDSMDPWDRALIQSLSASDQDKRELNKREAFALEDLHSEVMLDD